MPTNGWMHGITWDTGARSVLYMTSTGILDARGVVLLGEGQLRVLVNLVGKSNEPVALWSHSAHLNSHHSHKFLNGASIIWAFPEVNMSAFNRQNRSKYASGCSLQNNTESSDQKHA
jgi:hypothetical protein